MSKLSLSRSWHVHGGQARRVDKTPFSLAPELDTYVENMRWRVARSRQVSGFAVDRKEETTKFHGIQGVGRGNSGQNSMLVGEKKLTTTLATQKCSTKFMIVPEIPTLSISIATPLGPWSKDRTFSRLSSTLRTIYTVICHCSVQAVVGLGQSLAASNAWSRSMRRVWSRRVVL